MHRQQRIAAVAWSGQADPILHVEQGDALPACFFELIAVDGADPTDRETPLDRESAVGEAEDAPRRPELPRRERQIAARIEDVAVEFRIAAESVTGNFRGPVDPEARLLAPAEAKEIVGEMPLVGDGLTCATHPSGVKRVPENHRVD